MSNECASYEELISARVDGELRPDEQRRLRRHLDSCDGCRAFATSVGAMSVPKPQRFERNRWLRAALFATGVALLVGHVPDVLDPQAGADVHVARHQAAFVVGLAIVFVYVAWRPDRAYGLLPVTVALGAVLVIAVLLDVAAGNTELALERSHVLELLGMALAGWLGWEVGPRRRSDPRSGAGIQSRR
jgi:anti-sigma factor RsiW